MNRRDNASNGMFTDVLKIGCQCARGKGWIKLNERGKKRKICDGDRENEELKRKSGGEMLQSALFK